MNLKKLFGLRVKHYRLLSNLSQEELAERVGLSSHTISYIERGKNFISMSKLSILCSALDIKPYQLFIDITNMDNKNKIEEINNLLKPATEKQLNIFISLLKNIIDIEQK